MSVRSYPFDSLAPTQKRRKISTCPTQTQKQTQTQTQIQDSSEDDSSSSVALPDSHDSYDSYEVPTLPMDAATLRLNAVTPSSDVRTQLETLGISQTPIFSSPPPTSYQTQPTQILDLSSNKPASEPTVQVAASSPIQVRDSPKKSSPRKDEIKPFSFYSSRILNKGSPTIDLTTDDAPPYIGVSSDAESDSDIVPDFKQKFALQAKVPSVRELKMRREMDDNTKTIERVEESPISLKDLSRFTYKPPTAPPQFGGRLDSIKSSNYTGGIVGAYARSRPTPRPGVMLDLHLDDIRDVDMRRKVQRVRDILPDKSYKQILVALQAKKGNFDDAMDLLTTGEPVVGLTRPEETKSPIQTNQTSKKEARAPRKAIKDKWSSTQTRPRELSSSPDVQAKPKRRLMKGSAGASWERDSSPPGPIEIYDDESDEHSSEGVDERYEMHLEAKVLDFINTCEVKDLIDIATTTEEIAQAVLDNRPFKALDDVREVSTSGAARGKTGKAGRAKRAVGDKVVDTCIETFRGYEAVDTLIKKCEELGRPLAETIKSWGVDLSGATNNGELDMTNLSVNTRTDSGIGTPADDDGSNDVSPHSRNKILHVGKYMSKQPKNMAPGVTLKDYQLVGINWLNLLYERKTSCILADEMGLGKTCQVVAFLAHLLTTGEKGPHLVVVPASTLENWLREFKTFCPDLNVEPYYGNQKERVEIREALRNNHNFHVLVTTYNLATGDKMDRAFLKEKKFNVCVYDEGHMLKNSSSTRYSNLMLLPAKFRLLLTGTPLQNNLQELVSLLSFILPHVFKDKKGDLATIFKHKAKTTDEADPASSALLSATRIQKAKAMMTPFVLRRKKAQVLGKHLPEKATRVEYCELNAVQKELYDAEIAAAKDAIEARAAGKKPTKAASNLLMQLRKAAIHPFLFRRHFDDATIKKMSKAILKEDAYKTHDPKYIEEDMSVMNDFELNRLCLNFPKTLSKFAFKNEEWMNAGKIDTLSWLLRQFKAAGDRVLVFSQFTQVMDILEKVMSTLGITFLRLDGATKVEDRQDMIDQFHDEEDITVFLLSTKAGGFGINLACANKVIIFDSSFNPHDDRQAADRAHRVGQKRPVEVINLVTRGTIEEQILALANTKLALDQSVSGEEGSAAGEAKGEELVAKMMLGKNV